MKKRKVGVMIESFQMGVEDGIRKAAEIGADGFQIYCIDRVGGESGIGPRTMDSSARREFKAFVADTGLVISALCADRGLGFLDPKTNKDVVERSKECVDFAVDLGTNVLTTHVGTIPEDESRPEWKIGIEALTELSSYAESRGVLFASETGPESAETMKRFLDKIPTKAIRVNYDPANLIMWGFEHLGGVDVLKDYIVHTHAKDGVLTDGKPQEVPLGEGSVDFPEYLARLDAAGYDGFLTIEREVGDDPVSDIVRAVQFLRGL